MKQFILLIAGVLLFSIVYGQVNPQDDYLDQGKFAIVRDSSGFANIRNNPRKQADILDTLGNTRSVFCFDLVNGWYGIYYQKGTHLREGYIHSSRVILVNHYKKFTVTKDEKYLLVLKLDSISITIKTDSFLSAKRSIKLDSNKNLLSIDNRNVLGTDGEIPRYEYKQIRIKQGSQVQSISSIFLNDLFEPNLDDTKAFMDTATGKIYLIAYNSDGGEAYDVLWVIQNGHVISRYANFDPND